MFSVRRVVVKKLVGYLERERVSGDVGSCIDGRKKVSFGFKKRNLTMT